MNETFYISIFRRKSKSERMKRILCVLFVLVSISVTAQKSVSLKLNYKKGDSYKVKMSMKQTLGIMGGMDIEMGMKMNVDNVTDDEIITKSTIESVKANVSQGGVSMAFDSSMKDDELDANGKILQQQFAPMMKAIITQVVNKQGKVISTKTDPPVQGASVGQQAEYPETPITIGSTWSTEVTDNTAGKINMTYKVEKITDNTVFASITGTAAAMPGSKINGNLEIDIATGNPNKTVSNVVAESQGTTITVSVKMTSTKI